MNFWDTVKDAGSLKNIGLDVGSLSTDLFGDNTITSSLNKIIDFGSVGASIDEQKAIEAEQMRKKREEETKRLNARNNLSMPELGSKIDNNKKYIAFAALGIVVSFLFFKILRIKV